MRTKLSYILFALISIISKHSLSQEFNDDAAIWTNIELQKKINSNLSIQFNLQNRINNNISQVGLITNDIGATYKIGRLLKISAGYRFREKRRLDGSYSARNQFYAAIILKKRVKKFVFSYRNRVQTQYQDMYSSVDGMTPTTYERNKITLKYELNKRFELYTAQEVYSPFFQFKSIGIDRSRTYLGMVYNLTKKSSLETYFMFQRYFNSTGQARRDFIYGLAYSFAF